MKTVKRKLIKKYGDQVLITTFGNKIPVICFRNTGARILSVAFYNSRSVNPEEEKRRVINAVADLKIQDCESECYDTTTYQSCDDFLHGVNEQIPSSLKLLIERKY